jgi:chorismate dehydratase
MLKVSIVSYLNTAPFMYGLEKMGLFGHRDFDISKDYPSECARKLLEGEVDLGLVPVAILPHLNGYQIHGNTCIGSDGKVDSVVLLSDVPLFEIEEIVLDYQSRTSVQLCRILARELWKISPEFVPAGEETMKGISGKRAAVLIGDRVFDWAPKFKYVYDLSSEWKRLTGLPFVFAVWASVKKLEPSKIELFEQALQLGLSNINGAIELAMTHYPQHFDVENYLRNRISYTLDSEKIKGLETFLNFAGKLIT